MRTKKLIKGIRNKINNLIDDLAAQLGLQPKLIPVRVKSNKGRKKR